MNTQVELHIERCYNNIRERLKIPESDKQIFIENLHNSQSEIQGKSYSLLNPWFQIFEELIYSLHLIQKLIRSYWESTRSKDRFLYGPMLLISKACVESCAIRSLILNGFSESAETNYRSLIENLQLFIVLYHDKELSYKYEEMSYIENGENIFWYEYVSKGKLEKKLENIIANLKYEGNYFKNQQSIEKHLKKYLSNMVHSSCNSGFHCWMTVSLENPDILNLSTMGKISGYAPELLHSINDILYGFYALFIEINLGDPEYSKKYKKYKKVVDSFKVLLGRLHVYTEIFPIYEDYTNNIKKYIEYRT